MKVGLLQALCLWAYRMRKSNFQISKNLTTICPSIIIIGQVKAIVVSIHQIWCPSGHT